MKNKREKEYFTLNKDIREMFLKYIDENNLNKSKLLETLIQEYLIKMNIIK